MKKFTLLKSMLLLCALVAGNVSVSGQVFYESFNKYTENGGNDDDFTAGGSTAISSPYTLNDNSGWAFTKVYPANYCVKVGGSSDKGTVVTPTITFDKGKTYIISFRAAGYNNNKETQGIVVTTSTGKLNNTSSKSANITITKAEWGTYSVTLKTDDGTGTVTGTITIAAKNKSKNRFYLDDVYVYETASATITTAEYATFNSAYALDFSETGITAYTATDNGSSVTLNEITSGKVPANTPVVLYKDGADGTAINVPVISTAAAISGTNDLAVSTGIDVANMYVLANGSAGVGFYPWGGTNLSAGKVYLQATSSAREFLGFENGTTAIETVKTQKVDGKYYNLAGQLVTNPTKGLYIVNGKKVVIK